MLSSIEVPKHVLDVVKTLTSQHCENADALHAALRNEHDATAAKLESVDGEGKNTALRLADASREMNGIALRHAEHSVLIAARLQDLSEAQNKAKYELLAQADIYDDRNDKRYKEISAAIDIFHNRICYLLGGSTALIMAAIALVKYL